MTRTEYHRLEAPSLGGGTGEVVVHGHWGRPVLWFPSELKSAHEFAEQGVLDAVRDAVDGGRIKIYCVSGYDVESWSADRKPMPHRAAAHRAYEDWIIWSVVPFVRGTSGGRDDIAVAGPSMGAFHAVLFALRHPHVFRRAVAFSGAYDPRAWRGWGEQDELSYLMSPFQFLPQLDGDHLAYLRSQLFLTLVVGSGQWEDTTGANASTHALDGLLSEKRIPHECFDWGAEWPHDWSSWRAQAAVYLPALG
ncbi:esterase family protein [Nakamurella deserti]|uniref:esterase family protein n=1 Tax=Nakamurella deserti TaxID=2164074 RepID=UPI000DBE952E|nr:alpha/beta hydrolase-fold protein [Nakamurella deserti]